MEGFLFIVIMTIGFSNPGKLQSKTIDNFESFGTVEDFLIAEKVKVWSLKNWIEARKLLWKATKPSWLRTLDTVDRYGL